MHHQIWRQGCSAAAERVGIDFQPGLGCDAGDRESTAGARRGDRIRLIEQKADGASPQGAGSR